MKLRSAKDRKNERKKEKEEAAASNPSGGGDMMSDLMSALNLRRKVSRRRPLEHTHKYMVPRNDLANIGSCLAVLANHRVSRDPRRRVAMTVWSAT